MAEFSKAPRSPSRPLYAAAMIASLSSFLFGYTLAALNSVLKTGDDNDASKCYNGDDDSCPKGSILNDIDLSIWLQQSATGAAIFGAWLGTLFAAPPTDRYGRRTVLLINNTLFVLGAALNTLPSVSALLIGRFLNGLGIGCESIVVPILISELSHPDYRGKMTSIHQLFITIGILFAGIMGYIFVLYVDDGWRIVAAFTAVPAILQLLLSSYLPESPKWLVVQGRVAEAKQVLLSMRPASEAEEAEDELQSMIEESQETEAEGTWEELLQDRRLVLIGVTLFALQAITGVNSVIFYSTTIFSLAGVSFDIIGTVAVGAVNVIMAVVSVMLMDKLGRRALLLMGTSSMTASLLCLAIVLLTLDSAGTVQGILAVLCVLAYITGFSLGLAATVYVVVSDLAPTSTRSKAFALATSVNWFCNLLISMFTLSAIQGLGGVDTDADDDDKIAEEEKVGVSYMYVLFGAICAFAFLFVYTTVPETQHIRDGAIGAEEPLLVNGGGAGLSSGNDSGRDTLVMHPKIRGGGSDSAQQRSLLLYEDGDDEEQR